MELGLWTIKPWTASPERCMASSRSADAETLSEAFGGIGMGELKERSWGTPPALPLKQNKVH